ncbi:MAG: T9SS type A sorting domain-containing protein [Bacteroidota bacterium]
MKKLYFRILMLLCPFFMNSQVGIGSISIAPITGTNDIELRVYSYCSQVHYFNNYELTGTTPEHLVNLCYEDTGLLMPTDFTSSITLPNINTTGSQTITVNAYYGFYLSPDQSCSNYIIGPATLTFDAPLTESRMFQLNNNVFELKKVSLYPNPNNGTFSIDLPENADSVALSISDLSGKEVYSMSSYSSDYDIQVNDLSKGLYFVKIMYNQTTETLKFLVR